MKLNLADGYTFKLAIKISVLHEIVARSRHLVLCNQCQGVASFEQAEFKLTCPCIRQGVLSYCDELNEVGTSVPVPS